MITDKINEFLWGAPLLLLLILGGIFLSAKIGFAQLRLFRIFKSAKSSVLKCGDPQKGISPLQSFSTALAATVGTGSVVGVGTAIAAGGIGAVFWMWICAFIGMGISYCENFLSVKYSRDGKENGAMSYLEKIGKGKIIACIYALCAVLASLGMGNMAQANSIASAAEEGLNIPRHITAVFLIIFTAVTVSGRKLTAKLCEKLVPFMAVFFCLGSLGIILSCPVRSLGAFKSIFVCALSPEAIAGGAIGTVISEGLKRGAFSNEAGLGSTAAIHSSCSFKSPCSQGILGMAEVFIDTIVICTLTALVILTSGADLNNPNCTIAAYSLSFGGFGKIFISLCLILFALATIAGWFFIGEKSWLYLFPKRELIYKCLCITAVFLGGMYSPALIWGISDIFNALMAIPNMLGVLLLSNEIKKPFMPQENDCND